MAGRKQRIFIPLFGMLADDLLLYTFAQSFGSDLLINGDFSGWTGDNPNSWSVTGESGSDPAISEVGSGEDHTGAGTGSANWYKTAGGFLTLAQNVFTIGDWYEVVPTISVLASGSLVINDPTNKLTKTFAITGEQVMLGRAGATAIQAYIITNPSDVTVDGLTVRKITLDQEYAFAADGKFESHYTLPASPRPGDRVMLWVRADGDQNYWQAYVIYNDSGGWDFKLDSVSSAVATNRISVSAIGATDALKVVTSGDDFTCYTSANNGATWTQRGSVVTNSTHNTNTGIRTVYSSAFSVNLVRAS